MEHKIHTTIKAAGYLYYATFQPEILPSFSLVLLQYQINGVLEPILHRKKVQNYSVIIHPEMDVWRRRNALQRYLCLGNTNIVCLQA